MALACANCLRIGIVGVAETDGVRELLDLRLVSGEEMPAFGGAGAAVHAHVHFLFSFGQDVRFRRINADGDHVVLVADVRGQFLQAGFDSVQNLGAEHRAVVIDERENHGLLSEKLAERDGFAVLVAEGEVERNRLVQFLVNAHLFQQFGAHTHTLHRV